MGSKKRPTYKCATVYPPERIFIEAGERLERDPWPFALAWTRKVTLSFAIPIWSQLSRAPFYEFDTAKIAASQRCVTRRFEVRLDARSS